MKSHYKAEDMSLWASEELNACGEHLNFMLNPPAISWLSQPAESSGHS